MSFKAKLPRGLRTILWACGLGGVLVLAACSRFFDGHSDKNNPNRVVVINTKEVDCLKTLPQEIQQFVDDDSTSLTSVGQCLKTSLHTFDRRFKGDNANYFKASELQHFLNRYLLKGYQISDSFMVELMKLKVVLVGGPEDKITRDEIDRISELIDEIQPKASALNGKMKMLFFRETDASCLQDFTETQNKILDFAQFVLDKTQITQSRYEFSDLKSFITELDHFVGDSKSLKSLLSWMPLAESVKLVFLGDHAKLFTASEWTETTRWMVSAYIDVLEYYYQIKDLKLEQPTEWDQFMRWADQSFELMEKAPAMQDKHAFTADTLDRLIDDVWGLHLFKLNLSADLVKDTYKKVLVHFIEGHPGNQLSALTVDGITEEDLRLLKQEYHVWKMTQLAIDDMYMKKPEWSVPEIRAYVQNASVDNLLQRTGGNSLEKDQLQRAWQDFVNLLSLKPVVVYNTSGKMATIYNNDLVRTNFLGVNQLNVTRSLLRLVFNAYGDHSSPYVFDTLMPQSGMVQFEQDFRDFGRAIGFLDYRQANPAQRTFMEGNFFSYHGNGDNQLSFVEFYEQINMLLTGGRTVVSNIFADMKTQGCLTSDIDIFGHPIAQEDCFLKVFRKNLKVYLNHIPWMAQFLSGLSDDQFMTAYQSLMKVARLASSKPNRIEWAEIRTVTTVLQYVESLYTIYDTNHDQLLSEKEIAAATPRFASFIQSVAKTDSFTEDIFLYLVYEGKKPAGTMDVLKFKVKRAVTHLPNVDRLTLFNVIGVLKSAE
jgi:hypothetical protein